MISVLVPVYNTPYKWIKDCHISIMSQTFKQFEIVYVNDGSTSSETLKFLDEIRNNRFCNIIDLKENVGISKALNIGLMHCKYDYVARMDSDDIMYNNRLWYQYNYMIKNPHVDLVGTGMNYIKMINDKWILEINNNYHPEQITIDVITNSDWFLNHPTVMFKKNKVISIGGYNDKLRGYAEDFDLWARMFMNDMVMHNIKYNLISYRMTNESLSHKIVKDNVNHVKKLQDKIKLKHGLIKLTNDDIVQLEIKKDNNLNIGILIIATDKYIEFVKPLVDSINKFFLKDYNKTIFCFTDKVDYELPDNVVKIYQEHSIWPSIVVKRHEIIYKNIVYYKNIDVLYYIDADMMINSEIDEQILPDDRGLIAVIHPGYYKDKIQCFERNPLSTAYVNYEHHIYHCSGIQGGKKEQFLESYKVMLDNTKQDLNNNIIAVWHDESHWNHYLINNPDSYKELDCSYCYPEQWKLDLPKRIIALDKDYEYFRK